MSEDMTPYSAEPVQTFEERFLQIKNLFTFDVQFLQALAETTRKEGYAELANRLTHGVLAIDHELEMLSHVPDAYQRRLRRESIC